MKMGELIPSLKCSNVNIEHAQPEKMTQPQLQLLFKIFHSILVYGNQESPEEKEQIQRYKNSYLRKRVLCTWRRIRPHRYPIAHGKPQEKVLAYQRIFKDMKDLIMRYFQEEFGDKQIHMNAFTIRVFIWNQVLITERMKKGKETGDWSELLEMVDLLIEYEQLDI
ncbi:hypothetical protein [Hazenella coriacea]|uniref:Uncharacterized protein n=1 Tax=Hazenella coriacea TaxID=1179467 RepID=A0A4R3L9P5_9BACL|nr:hypothetical protein [Hazenella coriacea]TCS95948.1 hypothetical protein EDD58_102532 [Hazenella coriacea]